MLFPGKIQIVSSLNFFNGSKKKFLHIKIQIFKTVSKELKRHFDCHLNTYSLIEI